MRSYLELMEKDSSDTLFLGVWLVQSWNEPESRFSLYRCPLKKRISTGIRFDRFIYSIVKGRVRNGLPFLSKVFLMLV